MKTYRSFVKNKDGVLTFDTTKLREGDYVVIPSLEKIKENYKKYQCLQVSGRPLVPWSDEAYKRMEGRLVYVTTVTTHYIDGYLHGKHGVTLCPSEVF